VTGSCSGHRKCSSFRSFALLGAHTGQHGGHHRSHLLGGLMFILTKPSGWKRGCVYALRLADAWPLPARSSCRQYWPVPPESSRWFAGLALIPAAHWCAGFGLSICRPTVSRCRDVCCQPLPCCRLWHRGCLLAHCSLALWFISWGSTSNPADSGCLRAVDILG